MCALADTSRLSTVFVLDVDSIYRNMISSLASAMRLPCEAFVSGQDFLDAYDVSRPGCLVTEVRTPEVGGLEVQRRLAVQQAPLAVIFLSAYGTAPVIVRAMRMGAISFLEKPPNEHDLWETIQEALRENDRRRELVARNRARRERISSLEPHEQHMLQLIAQGCNMRDIADSVGVSVRTAEIRRGKLMQKLNTDTYVELLRFAFAVIEYGNEANGEDAANRWHETKSFSARDRMLAAP
ncbi:MAG: response regulator transcription factor [Thermoguttaceae bacterium]